MEEIYRDLSKKLCQINTPGVDRFTRRVLCPPCILILLEISRFGAAKYCRFNHVLLLLAESSYPVGILASGGPEAMCQVTLLLSGTATGSQSGLNRFFCGTPWRNTGWIQIRRPPPLQESTNEDVSAKPFAPW